MPIISISNKLTSKQLKNLTKEDNNPPWPYPLKLWREWLAAEYDVPKAKEPPLLL